MNNYNKLGSLLKREILNFSKKICNGIKKPEYKMVSNILYGVSESESCHLSKIGRSLKEPITLKKTIDRLSRGLHSFSEGERMLDNYAEIAKKYIDDKAIFVIDNSDITKPCSNALEGLSVVRDGSTGKYEKGYHTLEITALTKECKTPIPVYDRVYSSVENGFVSEDDEVLKGLKYISKQFGKGIRALDRGYDALTYYEYFLKANEKFIIRSKMNRNVLYKGNTCNILKVAKLFKGKYRMDFLSKNSRKIECKISIIPVSLPKYPEKKLNLVVVYGFGKVPMLLLSNLDHDDTRLAKAITKVYLMRWRIEENFKFKKQQYNLEDFRVRSLNSIRTIHRIVTLLCGLVSMLAEKRKESVFVMELIEISKRIYKPKKEKYMKKFMNYAIADGIFTVLNKTYTGITDLICTPKPPDIIQLSLFH